MFYQTNIITMKTTKNIEISESPLTQNELSYLCSLKREEGANLQKIKKTARCRKNPKVKQSYVLTDAQMHYYQTTNVGKGTGEIVVIDWNT